MGRYNRRLGRRSTTERNANARGCERGPKNGDKRIRFVRRQLRNWLKYLITLLFLVMERWTVGRRRNAGGLFPHVQLLPELRQGFWLGLVGAVYRYLWLGFVILIRLNVTLLRRP